MKKMQIKRLSRSINNRLRQTIGGTVYHADVEGYVDEAANGRIAGWLRSLKSPEPLSLDFLVNGRLVAERVAADLYRSDLQDAGIGDGCHGFEVTFDPLDPVAGARLKVEIQQAGSGAALLSRTVSATRHDLPSLPAPVPAASAGAVQVGPLQQNESGRYRVNAEKITKTHELIAWAIDLRDPAHIFDLDIHIDGAHFRKVQNSGRRGDLRNLGFTAGQGGIRLHLPVSYLEQADTHKVEIVAPDGTTATLFCAPAVATTPRLLTGESLAPEGVCIVVPVYNAADDLKICIDRLLGHTPGKMEIIFIDDASPDPRIARILEAAAAHPRITVLENAENLGFTKTVNKGLQYAGRRDVVILNSDARVTRRWLSSMLAAARALPRVATVTPMSDRAGAFSAPDFGNENDLPPGVDETTYARAFRRRQRGIYPEVPTGNGFCMLITRRAMDEIGLLDEEAFPRGYGEENDFCMRALRAGWSNLIDDRSYVFHDRNKSFGDSKAENLAAGATVLRQRYPEYSSMTRVFREDPGILFARMQARRALEDCTDPAFVLPRALFVVSTRTGGTPQTNLDLMRSFAETYDCWVLRCDRQEITLGHVICGEVEPVDTHRLQRPIDAHSHRSAEYDAVVESWLVHYDIELVHIRHLIWHSLNLPAIARRLAIPTVHSFHDFYALCPTVNLMKDDTFCGGTCTRTEGACTQTLWPEGSVPPVNRAWIEVWRERFAQAISECDAFVTTSDSARARLLEHMPSLPAERFFTIPHGRDFAPRPSVAADPAPYQDEKLRILVPGNIGFNKGLDIIRQLAELDGGHHIEFHVLGKVGRPDLLPGIILHGPYDRADFAEKAGAVRPHLGAVFSIWDETYCHTLTEMWMAGLPVAVFDFPTVAGRVRESGAGWVLDHHDIPTLRDALLDIGADPAALARKRDAARDWRQEAGRANSTRLMGAQYLDVYRAAAIHRGTFGTGETLSCNLRPKVAVVVSGTSQDFSKANSSVHIRLWERTRNGPERPAVFVRMGPETLLANLARGGIDGAIVQRNALPALWVDRFIEAFEKSGIPYILELDDDLLDVPADKDPQGRYAANAPRLKRLMRAATGVTVSTGQLEQKYKSINSQTRLVPNHLSRAVWALPELARKPDGMVRALYMGTVTHSVDLEMILPALEGVVREHPGFRLRLVGVTAQDLPGWVERIDIPPGCENYPDFVRWLARQREHVDFALAPLVDTPFNACKSDLKILEQGALGLPVLASDTGPYRALASVPGVTLVRNTDHAWKTAVKKRILHPETRRQDGAALRAWVFANRSLEPTLDAYDGMLAEVFGWEKGESREINVPECADRRVGQ